MRVLIVDAYEPGDINRSVTDAAVRALESGGNTVHTIRLVDDGFAPQMSPEERAAYHTDEPVVADEVRSSAAALMDAEAVLFCYPTIAFTLPAVLKSWLERVLVPGVGFVFDKKGKVKPGLTNIGRVGAITTSPHPRARTRAARDPGRRTVIRNLRMSCGARCRTSFVGLDAAEPDLAAVRKALRRW